MGIVRKRKKFNIILNDSFSGSTICNSFKEELTVDSSFINRLDKYIGKQFFDKNIIDTMIIFGGTNDSWIAAPIGELMYSNWTVDDLKCVLPAFCYLLFNAKNVVEDIIVIINNDLKKEITSGFIKACNELDVKYLFLQEIDKKNGHPTEIGMKQISEQFIEFFTHKIKI